MRLKTFTYATIYRRAILGSIGQSIAEAENCSCHRDVISIGKLVRRNDGPKEVEQILATMTKYGEETDAIRFVTSRNKGGVAAVQDKDKDKPHIF